MEKQIYASLVLFTFSLIAAAVADEVEFTIRQPIDGHEQAAAAAKRPWTCCDMPLCSRLFPPSCYCMDIVDECAPACQDCGATWSDPSLTACRDQYIGDPGPSCNGIGNDEDLSEGVAAADNQVVPVEADTDEAKTKADEEERPWECCDRPSCTYPPACRCMDNVDQCASTCKSCVGDDDYGHVCQDLYHGDPGPLCTEDGARRSRR